ncbi:hypothetical protein Afil01_20950 [Actinorhabdospora filicis]|uniref:DUF1684 domain-containing protein n=1 Tax=Actinorhabdospora filicis TaxID=1785913 RepID=A0A9W6W8S9_9ACTN|nr:DUF1684 domain-containing protein [Actinorhabdospora filicis]GLZ77288.1 hypothetical protein Afil01_20950 [Actinorhabdospora filicis]
MAFEDLVVSRLDGWKAWREGRDERFRRPDSALSLTSMSWLEEGPASFDEVPGTWEVVPDGVTLTASAADGFTLAGEPVDGTVLIPLVDTSSGGSLKHGERVVEVIERGGDYAFRVRDPKSPALLAFTGVPAYAPSAEWVIEADFVRDEREVVIGSVIEGLNQDARAAGTASFTKDGVEYSLTVFSGGGLYVLFRDGTSGVTTNASARWLDVEEVADGKVLLDFNRAGNLPCAFNEYSTCPVPPWENRLSLAIEAGEQIPA